MNARAAFLVVDAGNTRVKWALTTGHDWRESGAEATAEAWRLAEAWQALPVHPGALWACNVAGAPVRAAIEAAAGGLGVPVRWLASAAAQCGVVNGYENPAQLGADRWLAAIAARRRIEGACVVVNAGTAVTVDAIDAAGRFLGGLILPGVATMLDSLESRTAGLKRAPGSWRAFPANTADAMMTGAVDAATGAVARLAGRLAAHAGAPVPVVLSGGAAGLLAEQLGPDVRVIDALVLEGVRILAMEGAVP